MTNVTGIEAEQVRPAGDDRPPLSCWLGGDRVLCVVGPRDCRHDYMRVLAGVDAPAAGRLALLGYDDARLDRATSRWLRQRIGYVAPYLRLLSVISGWRNVMLAASYHGLADEATLETRAQALIQDLEAAADPHRLPAHMGQLQHMHLTIARALMLEPAFLFAEDPFRGLEHDERRRLGVYLGEIAPRYASAVVVATGDTRFARDYADRVLAVSPQGHTLYSDGASFQASDAAAISDRGAQGEEAARMTRRPGGDR